MLAPIVVRTKSAAAPISTSRSEYSTTSCPPSSLRKLLIDLTRLVLGNRAVSLTEAGTYFAEYAGNARAHSCQGDQRDSAYQHKEQGILNYVLTIFIPQEKPEHYELHFPGGRCQRFGNNFSTFFLTPV